MLGFDKNKLYVVRVHFPNNTILKDKHGEFNNLTLTNIYYQNGVYIGTDLNNKERKFNARLNIEYDELY